MYSRTTHSRSTETPMDFEFTSRPNIKPPWASQEDEQNSPRKRPLSEMNSSLASTSTPTFGRVQNVPFMLNIPQPQTEPTPPWVPPSSPFTAKVLPQQDLRDVDMVEASPPRPPLLPERKIEEEKEPEPEQRLISVGGMKRVFRSRQKALGRSKLAIVKTKTETDDEGIEVKGDHEDSTSPITQNTTHYTLNMSNPTRSPSEKPYILLGYLQFFFNLSLVLVFLYLLLQFILTVQRDVEHKVSEYSMEIVQEIAQCTIHYNTNLCATNPIPAMARQCGAWETCMNRDPTKVGRAKVGAELIAEVVNGFVEPISWKTLAFTLTSLSFLTVFINSLLSLYRSRHNPANMPIHHPQPTYPLPPSTPYPQHILEARTGWGKTWTQTSDIDELPSRRRKLESGVAKEIK